jgi:RNA polymerase sigma-70 factor (ECF subfamily)
VVLEVGDGSLPQAHAALTRLCQTCWLAVYAFVRKRGHSPEQTKDLTQAFFANFLEKQHVTKDNRERGRFRSFVMACVENFLRNENDRARAQKRGGGRELVSLDQQDAEARYVCEPTTEMDPAKAFDQRWAATLLNTVLSRLQSEFGATGRGDLFQVLQAHLWGDTESTPLQTTSTLKAA